MALNSESFNKDLYDLLKVRGYDPVPLNSKNQRVNVSQDADVFQFEFKKDGEDYGKAWVTVDDAHSVIVYYNEEQQDSPSTITPGVEYDDTWTGFCKVLKTWAQRRQLGFELKNASHVGDDMRQRDYYRMKEKLGESYHAMGKKASYNDAVPNVKIILQHNRALEEGEQRYRNIARIFLENQDGERFLAPTNRPGLARVYARHIAEGGVPNDDKWNHIKGMCEDYNKMAGFVRATRNKQFNESAQSLVNEGLNHYNNLRETLQKLTGHRGYHAYFESYTPALMEGDGEDLSEMFMSSSMDPRIESALPIISRLQRKVNEMEEVSVLDEWADDIINEKLELDEDAEDKIEQLETLARINKDPAVEQVINAKMAQFSKKKGLNELSPGKKWDYTAFGSENVNKLLSKIPGAEPDEASRLLKKATQRNQNINKVTKNLTSQLEESEAFVATTPGQDPYEFKAETADEAYKLAMQKFNVSKDKITLKYKEDHFSLFRKSADAQQEPARADSSYSGTQGDPLSRATAKAQSTPAGVGGAAGVLGRLGMAAVRGATGAMREDASEDELEEARTKKVNLEVTDKGAVYINDTRITGRETKWGVQNTIFQAKVPLDQVVQTLRDNGFGNIRLDPQYSMEMGIQIEEDLGPEQKRVGQLGPYEKVGPKGAVGKLVGASESIEYDELNRIIDIAKFNR